MQNVHSGSWTVALPERREGKERNVKGRSVIRIGNSLYPIAQIEPNTKQVLSQDLGDGSRASEWGLVERHLERIRKGTMG